MLTYVEVRISVRKQCKRVAGLQLFPSCCSQPIGSVEIGWGFTSLVAFETSHLSTAVVGEADPTTLGASWRAELLLASPPGEIQEAPRGTALGAEFDNESMRSQSGHCSHCWNMLKCWAFGRHSDHVGDSRSNLFGVSHNFLITVRSQSLLWPLSGQEAPACALHGQHQTHSLESTQSATTTTFACASRGQMNVSTPVTMDSYGLEGATGCLWLFMIVYYSLFTSIPSSIFQL